MDWPSLRQKYITTPVLMRSVPVGVVIAAGVLATTWTHSLLSNHQDLLVRTYETIDTTKDVLIGLDDAETGQRGYLISSDRRFLDPYRKALDRLGKLQSRLESQVSDNAGQTTLVAGLEGLIAGKLGELVETIRIHDEQGAEAAQRREFEMMQRATMDDIRHVIGKITENEKTLVAKRQSAVDEDEQRIRLVAILVALLSILTRAGIEIYLVRLSRQPSHLR